METFIKFYLKTLLSFARVLPFLHSDNPKDKIQKKTEILLKILYYIGAGHADILQNSIQPFNPLTPIPLLLLISNEELISVQSGLKQVELRNTPVTSCLVGSTHLLYRKDLCPHPFPKWFFPAVCSS